MHSWVNYGALNGNGNTQINSKYGSDDLLSPPHLPYFYTLTVAVNTVVFLQANFLRGRSLLDGEIGKHILAIMARLVTDDNIVTGVKVNGQIAALGGIELDFINQLEVILDDVATVICG